PSGPAIAVAPGVDTVVLSPAYSPVGWAPCRPVSMTPIVSPVAGSICHQANRDSVAPAAAARSGATTMWPASDWRTRGRTDSATFSDATALASRIDRSGIPAARAASRTAAVLIVLAPGVPA